MTCGPIGLLLRGLISFNHSVRYSNTQHVYKEPDHQYHVLSYIIMDLLVRNNNHKIKKNPTPTGYWSLNKSNYFFFLVVTLQKKSDFSRKTIVLFLIWYGFQKILTFSCFSSGFDTVVLHHAHSKHIPFIRLRWCTPLAPASCVDKSRILLPATTLFGCIYYACIILKTLLKSSAKTYWNHRITNNHGRSHVTRIRL
jgi:hypothetical protein